MYYNQIQHKTDSKDKLDDSNKWYVEIYNLPLHFNKEDIVYFIWKTLDKCRALKKATNPVLAILFRLFHLNILRSKDA
jgi:hypothetical protein